MPARASKSPVLLGALLVAVVFAAWLRLPDLSLRPMHGDEAVHAAKFDTLWSQGTYTYDPREYHGPTLYYFAWPLVILSGARDFGSLSEATLRLSTALFGIGLLPLLWLVRDGLDSTDTSTNTQRRWWIVWAALFAAASPLFVFYARYYIQETPLVFWTFLAIGSAWRFQVEGKNAWLVATGLSIGLMLATKETAVIAIFCACLATWAARWKFKARDIGIIAGAAVAIAALCFSTLGRNPRGVLDALAAVGVYGARASGAESQGALHQHPPQQYFEWLLWAAFGKDGPRWSEWAIALPALVGIGVAIWRWKENREEEPSWTRFALTYTLSMALVYSLIPYKTPWCALGFWHGATWLAGIGAAWLCSGAKWRQLAFGAASLAAVWNLSLQARAGSLDERLMLNANNPWVYAHPTAQAKRLGDDLQKYARASGKKNNMVVVVIASGGDYWPIPFYARSLRNVGYFDAVPPQMKSAKPEIVIASADAAEQASQVLGDGYESEFFGLRRGVVMSVFVERSLWKRAHQ